MSYHRRYKLKDDRFGLLALTLREKAGLTQTEVAHAVGVSERTIRHWEGGTAYPDAANLKRLIEMHLRHGAFIQGHKRDEAKAFWEQATESASRRKTIFDEVWFAILLKQQLHTSSQLDEYTPAPVLSPFLLRQADWGEAIDVASFYGREQELAELEQWVLKDRCRVVILLGMGGIGKTTLSVKLAQQVTPHFEFVFWRSLRNAPPLREIVADCIQTLSEQQYTSLPENVERSIALLIELLRKRRCLLVLDNVETLLQVGSIEGRYHEEYEDYRLLIQRVAETTHRSCLLLTSREMLSELEPLVGTQSPVRTLKVFGLDWVASQQMLKDKELFGTQESWKVLIEHYSGNPLALKIVAATVRDLFGGDIAMFLREEPGILHTVRQLLDTQFERLAPLERDMMYWLAIERDPVSFEELGTNLSNTVSRRDVLTALKS
ncbi:MAG: NB-ARC domain-containing protein, partial [Chloroflexota bacterium]|nr:NB-ARC domain-containing protein [Chloroflexota bacterium]